MEILVPMGDEWKVQVYIRCFVFFFFFNLTGDSVPSNPEAPPFKRDEADATCKQIYIYIFWVGEINRHLTEQDTTHIDNEIVNKTS